MWNTQSASEAGAWLEGAQAAAVLKSEEAAGVAGVQGAARPWQMSFRAVTKNSGSS